MKFAYVALVGMAAADKKKAGAAQAKLDEAKKILEGFMNSCHLKIRKQFPGHVAACNKTLRSKVEALELRGAKMEHDGNKRMLLKSDGGRSCLQGSGCSDFDELSIMS